MVNKHKNFRLAYNSQITTTLGLSTFEMVFNPKPPKPIMFTANFSRNTQGHCQPAKESIFVINYCYILTMKIIFIIRKSYN